MCCPYGVRMAPNSDTYMPEGARRGQVLIRYPAARNCRRLSPPLLSPREILLSLPLARRACTWKRACLFRCLHARGIRACPLTFGFQGEGFVAPPTWTFLGALARARVLARACHVSRGDACHIDTSQSAMVVARVAADTEIEDSVMTTTPSSPSVLPLLFPCPSCPCQMQNQEILTRGQSQYTYCGSPSFYHTDTRQCVRHARRTRIHPFHTGPIFDKLSEL